MQPWNAIATFVHELWCHLGWLLDEQISLLLVLLEIIYLFYFIYLFILPCDLLIIFLFN